MSREMWLAVALCLLAVALAVCVLQRAHVFGASADERATGARRLERARRLEMFEMYDDRNVGIAVVGDSHVARAEWSRLTPGAVGFGVNGETTTGLLQWLPRVLAASPCVCCLMIGCNDDVDGIPLEQSVRNYAAILDSLLVHDAEPVVFSTLFVARDYPQAEAKNVRIAKLDDSLRQLTASRGAVFVDLNAAICENGYLLPRFTDDAIHLNAAGYAVWIDSLRQAISR